MYGMFGQQYSPWHLMFKITKSKNTTKRSMAADKIKYIGCASNNRGEQWLQDLRSPSLGLRLSSSVNELSPSFADEGGTSNAT